MTALNRKVMQYTLLPGSFTKGRIGDHLPSDTHHANLGPVGGTAESGLHSGAWVIPISQVVYSTACGSDRVALNNLYQKANNQLVKYTYTLPAGVAARSVCKGFC